MATTNDLQIKLEDVSKSYHKQVLLNKINLDIYRGDAIALLGPNGCGKSTMMRLIGQLSPVSTGKVSHSKSLKIGYVAPDFPDSLLTPETLFKQLMAIDQLSGAYDMMAELVEQFGISQMLKTPISYLSKGSKQKINVIQALLSRPDILLLDEPLSGQDVASQVYFIKLIQKLNEEGVTVIMCCHEPFLTEALARDVYHVKEGQLHLKESRALDTAKTLYAVIITDSLEEGRETFLEAIQHVAQQIEESETDCQLICTVAESQQLLSLCVAHQVHVRRLTHELI